MGIELPGSVRWLAEKVVGADWPDADETAMNRLADAWKETATTLQEITGDAEQSMTSALTGIEGDVHVALAERWATLGTQGALKEIEDLARQLGESLAGSAEDVRYAKLTIIAALVALAAELAALAVATVMTLGAASPGVVAAEAATQVTVRMIIRQLVIKILKRAATGAGIGASISSLTEFGIQGIENYTGRRDGVDWGNVFEAGGQGAVKGAVKGAIAGATGLPTLREGGVRVLTDPRNIIATIIGGEVQKATVGEKRGALDGALILTGLDDDVERLKDNIPDFTPFSI
ncbi:hypothetical protein H0264_06265 [Nocardia huaxiensis]|uniref:Outer membrane channel protein CpnT-like N-terminal domain-containing protein n=1 Tax=Nocardia huaxiensis TaxID=2755382 RepID=A0A7D6ZJA8_9NOCA|nr:hypothetical protein [Nocardia huaxiensis]QLY31907.1 hypothetical protein H0264_06265 [Nocardia huaxiensis]